VKGKTLSGGIAAVRFKARERERRVADLPASVLVEALEEEFSERSVGFRIDDEDLEDLRTVRDAVDYVYAKLEAG